ncbi:MAG: SpoIIE family protein phosphatase [Bacteroidetes bacterium]|nr:SpoIIE family protein phosphatase [Bacteroidota bacterium]
MKSHKRIKIVFSILLPLLFCAFHSWSQKNTSGSFIFQGVVYGYHHEPSRNILKKSKPFVIEGLLSGVSIKVYDDDKLIYQKITNNNGELRIALPLNRLFKLELSKEGYDTNILQIDTRHLPKAKNGMSVAFIGAEFMLNSFIVKEDNKDVSIGSLYFDDIKGSFEFVVNFKKEKKADNSIELMRKAVLKNKTTLSSASYSVLPFFSPLDTSAPSIRNKSGTQFGLSPAGIQNILPEDVAFRKTEIERERMQLEEDKTHVVSKQDSIVISAREAVIHASEVELQNALTLIQVQKSELSHKKRELYITIAGMLLLSISSLVLYIYYRDKKRTNQILETQNRNILDSITYAKRIQQSILIDEEEIKKVLPDFFVYYQPKDIVSGDFYWFSNLDDKLVVAVVDCTGHGVPGAFMSLVANTILNQIVNEKHITDPALILSHLHKGVTNALHQEKINSISNDGMDMALCVINKGKNKIMYAGAINPLYIVHNNEVNVVKADMQSIGGRRRRTATEHERKFTNHTVAIKEGMSFYMSSDGYADQFGGESRKKIGTEKFKQLLLDIGTQDMSRQKDIIQQTMKEWRSGYRQIDDMLVMGFKI